MWPKTFSDRLAGWSDLRLRCNSLPPANMLSAINSWWFDSPWIPYHLHWDDRDTWPDPWQLLDDNLYCGLARGLGILYTIAIVDRPEIQDAVLVETQNDNLVLVASGKYILNWDQDEIVNISLGAMHHHHRISQQELKLRIK